MVCEPLERFGANQMTFQAESPRDWPMQLVEKEMLLRGRKPAKRAGRIPKRTAGFNQAAYDALLASELVEVRIIAATQPQLVSGTSSKTAEIMELNLTGGATSEKLEWARERLGSDITIDDVWEDGQEIDVIGITKGKGFQGSVMMGREVTQSQEQQETTSGR